MQILNSYISNLSDTKRKIFLNIFWSILGKIVNMLGVLFVGILIARYLGPEQYGLMNYVISYVTIFSVIAGFGLENIEIRELSKNSDRKEYILGTAFILRLFFSIVTFLLIISSLFIYKTDTQTTILILIYSLFVFSGCFNVIRNYFTSIVQNEYVVKSEIARTFIGAAIKIALLWFEFPLIYFIVAMTLDSILVSSGYIVSYNRKVGKIRDWKYDSSLLVYLVKESFPLMLTLVFTTLYQRIDHVMIKNMIGDESLGYFSVATQLINVVLVLPLILVQTISPVLVRIKHNNMERYKKKKEQFVSIILWISIIASTMVSILSYWLILYLFGEKYLAAVPVLQIMSWKAVGMALSAASGQIIIMENIQRWTPVRSFLSVFICIILNLIFIPKYGIIGSAWVSIITIFFVAFLSNILIPEYRDLMKMQCRSFLFGWREIIKIKKLWLSDL